MFKIEDVQKIGNLMIIIGADFSFASDGEVIDVLIKIESNENPLQERWKSFKIDHDYFMSLDFKTDYEFYQFVKQRLWEN